MMYFTSILIMFSIFLYAKCYLYVEPIVPDKAYTKNYIYIKSRKYTWQEAQEVCASLNGSLVNLDSWEMFVRMRRLQKSSMFWDNVPHDYAWIGLTNTASGMEWQDCTPFNFSTFVYFKDSNHMYFDSSKQCYKTKPDLDFKYEQKECDEDNGAICEQRIEGNTCPMSDLLSLELRGVESSNKADCKRTCESDIDCYAIVSYSSNNCLLLKTKEGNGQEVNIAIRQCISGEVKQESDVITPTPVKDQNVVLDCSNTAKNPIASASLSYVYLPISCYNYSTVENVTIVESTTVTQNVTITDEVTQSVEVTLTVNFTMTENVNITDYVIVKENVTRTENVTVTQYIERTEYVTENAVTAIVTSFAPYTVTVQVPITPLPSACEDQTSYINTSNTRYIEEAVQNISKALYMDKKTTNSYIRTKTSAQDNRPSSVTMGYVGIVCVVVPLVLILLSDLKTIYVHMSAVCRSYNGPPSPPA